MILFKYSIDELTTAEGKENKPSVIIYINNYYLLDELEWLNVNDSLDDTTIDL
jgi:hypothetical protein